MLPLAGLSLYALVEDGLVSEVDRALLTKVRLLSGAVDQADRELHLEFADPVTRDFLAGERGEHLQLYTAIGDVLYRSPSLGDHSLPLGAVSAEPAHAWVDVPEAGRCRTVTLAFEANVGEESPPGTVPAKLVLVLAHDARDVVQTLSTLRSRLVIVGLATLVVTAATLVWVVRRSARPLVAASERIAMIDESDLSIRLDASRVPSELMPIVKRVNGLLARLEAAFERERSFSDDVAHELRTPLAALRTTLEVENTRSRSPEEYARAIEAAAAIAVELQGMVERLLQLARLDAGCTAIESVRYDLADFAVETWEPYATRAHVRHLRVDLDLQHELQVSFDRELLGLILRNLHDNAVTYADPGGHVRIAVRSDDDGAIHLEVSNSGSRLDEAQASAATQRFWRGDSARTDAGLHCGLGLAVVEKATAALGGTLKLSSRVAGEFVAQVVLNGAARNPRVKPG